VVHPQLHLTLIDQIQNNILENLQKLYNIIIMAISDDIMVIFIENALRKGSASFNATQITGK